MVEFNIIQGSCRAIISIITTLEFRTKVVLFKDILEGIPYSRR